VSPEVGVDSFDKSESEIQRCGAWVVVAHTEAHSRKAALLNKLRSVFDHLCSDAVDVPIRWPQGQPVQFLARSGSTCFYVRKPTRPRTMRIVPGLTSHRPSARGTRCPAHLAEADASKSWRTEGLHSPLLPQSCARRSAMICVDVRAGLSIRVVERERGCDVWFRTLRKVLSRLGNRLDPYHPVIKINW
jgi:hypothetical protein